MDVSFEFNFKDFIIPKRMVLNKLGGKGFIFKINKSDFFNFDRDNFKIDAFYYTWYMPKSHVMPFFTNRFEIKFCLIKFLQILIPTKFKF
jgi:hypothetical protein